MSSTDVVAWDVAIVTVTYNAEHFIDDFAKAVQALFNYDPRFKLVIVDNDSKDKTVPWLEAFFSSEIQEGRVIVEAVGVNRGFGAGCNIGVRLAGDAELLWFLNPDTQIEISTALELIKCFDNDESLSSVGSLLKNQVGEVTPGSFRFPELATVFLSCIHLGLLDRLFSSKTLIYDDNHHMKPVDWLTGASFMIKKQHFDSVDGFDETFFLYFEEIDLFYRLQQKGYKSTGCNNSVVYHISGASTGINKQLQSGLLPRRPKYWFESRRHFYMKNYGRLYFLIIDMVYIVGSVLGRLKAFILNRKITRSRYLLRDILQHSAIKSKLS